MTDTPRTDVRAFSWAPGMLKQIVTADFARELEREVAALMLKQIVTADFARELEREIAALRKDAERYSKLRLRWIAVAAFETGQYAAPAGMTLCHDTDLDRFVDNIDAVMG
jgi:hypothetical protein